MKKLFYQSFFVAIAFSSNLLGIESVTPAQSSTTMVQSQDEFKAKKLKCHQMSLLNRALENSPNTVVRSKIACAKAAKTIQAINEIKKAGENQVGIKKYFATDAEERFFILGHLKLMIDPVCQFFGLVREQKAIVTPVIAESLGITTKEVDKSWLLKFFETKEEPLAFFDHSIKSLDDLKSLNIEFIKVFGDVNESLSERARKACDEVIQKMQEAQKLAQAKNKA